MQITGSSTEIQRGPADWFTAALVHFTDGTRTAWHTDPQGQTRRQDGYGDRPERVEAGARRCPSSRAALQVSAELARDRGVVASLTP